MRHPHLAERIEDLVKEDENLALCDFCDIVHALARIVTNAGIWVAEAGQDWGHDFFEIASDFLDTQSGHVSGLSMAIVHTGPRAIEAAASPMSPPLRA